ncbi:MAG: 3-hydroxybutyryl-CoA dehydratase [Rhizobacter sp.]|nr:3-hydroxybutyryl-CoA dehydratase [Rhizobacter sp.]
MSTPTLDIDGAVATITLRRPEQANRLGPDDLEAIHRHIAAVNDMQAVLVLKICSGGKYFCSGYDIGALGGTCTRRVEFDEVVNALEDCRPVTIAQVHGGVYGGGTDLTLACDFRLGAEGVDMFMPAARLGLHFYKRGMERYVSRMGLDNAKRLFLTAARIDAAEMLRIGFLTQLVAGDALQDSVDDLTATLTAMAPIALLGMKKHLNLIGRGALDEAALQRDVLRSLASADLKEGGAAWKEKRTPQFVGR